MITLGKLEIEKGITPLGLTLLDIEQKTYRGIHTSDVKVKGYSRSLGRVREKTFRIMSVNPDVITRIIRRHWY